MNEEQEISKRKAKLYLSRAVDLLVHELNQGSVTLQYAKIHYKKLNDILLDGIDMFGEDFVIDHGSRLEVSFKDFKKYKKEVNLVYCEVPER